jgi:DnaJ-class molecular chaperone
MFDCLSSGTADTDVRKAYKKAALKFHPDRNRQKDQKGQVQAEESWAIITKKYDQHFGAR